MCGTRALPAQNGTHFDECGNLWVVMIEGARLLLHALLTKIEIDVLINVVGELESHG